MLALARQQLGDRLDRLLVTWALLEVRLERVEATTALLDDADEPRQLETQRELAIRVGLEAELDLAQREQLGDAILDAEEMGEALDDLEVVRRHRQHAAIHVDGRGVIAELDGGELSRAQAHVSTRVLIERQPRRFDERIDGRACTTSGAIQIDQAIDRPLRDGIDRARAADRSGATPRRGRTAEHGGQDRQRLLALAELGGHVGCTHERVEIATIRVGEPAQTVEQLLAVALLALHRDEIGQPAGALAAELEGATHRLDRRRTILQVVA